MCGRYGRGGEGFQVGPNFIPHSAKERQALFFGALKRCRVFKILVEALSPTWEQRADLPDVVADSQHVIERLAFELIEVLRAVTGNINTQLFHHSDRFGPHAPWSCAGALHFETLSCRMPEQAFGPSGCGRNCLCRELTRVLSSS